MANPVPKSSRRTSKLFLGVNTALLWGAVFYSIYVGLSNVAIASLSIIASLFGVYMGVGHMDLRVMKAIMTGAVGQTGLFPPAPEPPASENPLNITEG